MQLMHGQWTFDGLPDHEIRDDHHVAQGIDGSTTFRDAAVSLTVCGFATATICGDSLRTENRETDLVVWNGRLDNAPDLARELGLARHANCRDADLVASAYAKWGTEAL